MSESRSTRRFHKQVTAATRRREGLLDKGKLSLESGLGKLVIVVSNAPDFKTTMSPEMQKAHFLAEAERLSEQRLAEHQEVEVRRKAVVSDIKFDLADPEVTDMILIGHGSIDSIWTDVGGKYLSWREFAKATSHLKQGKIEQRMCGAFPFAHNVALGTFAVSHYENVLAAPNEIVPNTDPGDEIFRPIYSAEEAIHEQIAALDARYAGQVPTIISDKDPVSSI